MINNCFNYIGSKDRIFSAIDINLNKDKENFVDLFCGSAVVGVNEIPFYKKVMLNDACWQLVETLKCLRDNSNTEFMQEIQGIINEYELSITNKEGFNRLRDYYNSNTSQKETFSPYYFYCLLTHSFNNSIQFNKNDEFNVPFGKDRCYFNPNLQKKLEGFQTALNLNKDKVTIKCMNFDKLVEKAEKIINKTMFYVDPPYLSSDSSYGRIFYLGKWDAIKEKSLYKTLDFIDEKGGSFLLSNVLENNGFKNEILAEWSKKYNVVNVSSDFSNCNYQRKSNGKTVEVLIRNY